MLGHLGGGCIPSPTSPGGLSPLAIVVPGYLCLLPLPVEVLMWAGERGTDCWRNLVLFHMALSEGHDAPEDAGQRACSQRPEL